MIYEYSDRVIRDLNKRNLRAFDRLKQLKFDELNIIGAVKKTYEESIKLAKKRYYQIAYRAYIDALIIAMVDAAKAEERAEDAITEDWVLDMLEDYNEVTLYRFLPESDRKQQRLVEALVASHDKGKEIDKALRLWTLQEAQYAIESVDKATLMAYKDAGVKKVRWNTEKDDKVCKECKALNGKVFLIDKAPAKKHPNCRCWYSPIL